MRNAFLKTLFEEAQQDTRIVLLTGDLGFSVFEEFVEKLPKQFINAGVAEQNMTGLAAGLAMEGRIPVIYSIVPFVTMRNFEQIRNDIVYQNLNVKVVGVGAGFSYGPYGHTHHGLEDIALMRILPGLTIFSPSDPIEAQFTTQSMLSIMGPTYLRLGKAGEPNLHNSLKSLKVGKGAILNVGKDVTFLSTGPITANALKASDLLKLKGVSVSVVSMHTLKPLDKDLIIKLAKKTKAIISLEEHSITGGLGSAVAEILAENRMYVPFKRLGVSDRFTKEIGSQEFMREKNKLSVGHIVNAAMGIINAT